MIQPLAFMTPDASVQGFHDLPEFPFALEPRTCTRFEMQRYAREAYEAGQDNIFKFIRMLSLVCTSTFNKTIVVFPSSPRLNYYTTSVTRAYGRDFAITVEMQKYSPAL